MMRQIKALVKPVILYVNMKNQCCGAPASGGNAVYGLGLIGAAVYYIGHATTFWVGVLGCLKALVWPTFLVYEVLKFLHG